jgi:hypothetical protein
MYSLSSVHALRCLSGSLRNIAGPAHHRLPNSFRHTSNTACAIAQHDHSNFEQNKLSCRCGRLWWPQLDMHDAVPFQPVCSSSFACFDSRKHLDILDNERLTLPLVVTAAGSQAARQRQSSPLTRPQEPGATFWCPPYTSKISSSFLSVKLVQWVRVLFPPFCFF